MHNDQRCAPFEIKSVDNEERTFSGIVAVYHNIDLGGDIIDSKAYEKDIGYFVQNGVTRDEHQVTTGKILDAKGIAEGLYFTGKVSATPAGDNQLTLLRDGVYKFMSVGQRVKAKTFLQNVDDVKSYWEGASYSPTQEDMDRACYGARLITRAQPYEASTTFAPMNERTSITSVKSAAAGGRKYAPALRSALETVEELIGRADEIKSMRAEDGRVLSAEAVALLGLLQKNLGRLEDVLVPVEVKGVVPFKAAPVVDGPWDAAAARKRLRAWATAGEGEDAKIDFAKYRRGFAWFDSSKPDDLGSYKLPHHDIRNGKFVTVKAGVEAAAAAVDGARGGAGIPEGDRDKVKTHLGDHYHQWDGKPPWDGGKSDHVPVPRPELTDQFNALLANLSLQGITL